MVKTPVNGNNMIGSKEVTGMGAASVIHQMIIQMAIPITFHALWVSMSSGDKYSVIAKNNGPAISPYILAPIKDVFFKKINLP